LPVGSWQLLAVFSVQCSVFSVQCSVFSVQDPAGCWRQLLFSPRIRYDATMRNFPFRKCIYVVVTLAAIYFGSYYAMVERWEISPSSVVARAFAGDGATFPEYRLRQEWVYSLYAPMHAIDRKLRPGFWSPSKLE
jgi:hypothetical protein